MSDELIEGHALRGRRTKPEEVVSKTPARIQKSASRDDEPPKPRARSQRGAPPAEEPTGPYIILEPPLEAGDVLSHQSEMATFHKGLQPIIVDETASAPTQPGEFQETPSPADQSLAADLPWSVIESTSPDLFAGSPPKHESGAEQPSAEVPPDFLPHFHTPTGTFPPVKDSLLPSWEAEEPAPAPGKPEPSSAEPPPDFLPHFHTPTGILPAIKDEFESAQEGDESAPLTSRPQAPPTELPPDFLPHFHTPTGTFPPIDDNIPSNREAGETAPTGVELPSDFVPHFHTPTGTFPPIRDEQLYTEESEEAALPSGKQAISPADLPPDSVPDYRTPAGILPTVGDEALSSRETEELALSQTEPDAAPAEPLPDFLPNYHTPSGILPPIRDNQQAARQEPPHPGKLEALDVAPPPVSDIEQPVPITHFQEGLHLSPETEDTDPPPIAPISDEPSEFIPLFHTPTSVLPHVPEEVPVLQGSSVDATGEEQGDEVVDAEWVVDVDRRLHHARRKLRATADRASSSDRRMKSRLLTALAVVVLTVLAVLVPLTIRSIVDGAAAQPGTGQPSDQSPQGNVPDGATGPGAPLLLTPTPTTLPLYSHGRLAYSSNRDGDFEIYTLDMRSGQLTRLTDHPAADRSPKWSPDGRQLVFVSDRSGNDDLYLVSANRSEPVQLTSGSGSDRNPAWSPDGDLIIFSRETVDGSHLVAMPTNCLDEPDSCEGQTHALTPGGYDLFPSWSPDGRWIAFAASDFPGLPSVIALMGPEGDNYGALSGTGTSDFYPAWSPDGKRIAFVSYAQGDYDLWVMGADGQGLLQLTQSEATDVEPAWSPDGTFIVFASDRSAEGDFELHLIRSDCTSRQADCEASLIQLTNDTSDDLNPDWTP